MAILNLFQVFPMHVSAGDFPRSEGSDPTTSTLQQEAYYHFFLEEYLTAATRLRLLEETIENDPATLNDTRLLLGSLFLSWGMHRAATRIFDELVETFPPGKSRNEVLTLIERLQYRRSLHESVILTFNVLNPSEATDQARYMAGMSHYSLGAYDLAIDTLNGIPADSPYYFFANLASSQSHFQMNRTDLAIRQLEGLLNGDTGASSPDMELTQKIRLILGHIHHETGNPEKALLLYSWIPIDSAFFPEALFATGWVQMKEKHYPEAILAFRALIQANPRLPHAEEAWTVIGEAFYRMGAIQAAYGAYDQALLRYQELEGSMERIRKQILDVDQLDLLLQDTNAGDGDLGSFLLDDENQRFWVRQYSELVSLERYFDQKIKDMDVFTVLVDHREKVFRDDQPVVMHNLRDNPMGSLQVQMESLKTHLGEAAHEAAWIRLFHPDELQTFQSLNSGLERAEHIRRTISHLPEDLEDRSLLAEQAEQQRHRLNILKGGLIWNVVTETPARMDDLERETKKLEQSLNLLKNRRQDLAGSIPDMEKLFIQFRRQIAENKTSLLKLRHDVTDVRKRLLIHLQTSFLKSLDQHRERIEALGAQARFSQLQILDRESQK
jgi:tetratricopeptide (TPR) repeat protein